MGGDNELIYGVLHQANIGKVIFGDYIIDPWYGNTAYFDLYSPKRELGIMVDNGKPKAQKLNTGGKVHNGDNTKKDNNDVWIDTLYVCEYCFKYTIDRMVIESHRMLCQFNTSLPLLGRLVYRDDKTPYLIRQIRGFQHSLFCQNLCLFSKLFLDDKSVYYNVDQFDFFILYGFDDNDFIPGTNKEPNFKPMGFFSKEIVSWDGDNNLACICVFPPYQRRHLGSLLIEFLYEIARTIPGQYHSGPEFPLSPFGKVSYLAFWSRRLAQLIMQDYANAPSISLKSLANSTGFRKEDILITLCHMKIIRALSHPDQFKLLLGNLKSWCIKNKVDYSREERMLNEDFVLF